ncbi:YopX family protein, partial [Clostridioides difficile]|uniref:YopX family protein n=4 Tax=Clostridioides difficile TaxID=1496 RepID=UPI001F1D37AA
HSLSKFREWNKNGKEMYSYDEMMCYSKNLLREWVYSGVYLPTSNENFEVMIYTGLKDCIRKEIYEGDIVSYILSFEEFIGEVKFEEGFFVIDNEMLGENVGLFHEIAVVKVIGNIYENPEMLEKIRKPKVLED